MRSLGFYSLSNAWLFALAAPLVLFYFLKLKRPRVQVPSLVLWRRVVQDRRVNSPFQRFRRNLLLLLQLLLLLLLATAALQPFWRAGPERAERVPVLLDTSASMAALDRPGGRSRLELAKKRVEAVIDGLLPDQRMCLIAFDRTARKIADFTDNKRVLRRALEEARVSEVESDLEEALRMTAAVARGGGFEEVLLLSDGNVPKRAHFDLPFRLNYRKLPPAGPNAGITRFAARRDAAGHWQVFVVLRASARMSGPARLAVRAGGRGLAERHVTLRGGERERLSFEFAGRESAQLEARLESTEFDSLAADNVAYLRLPKMRPLQAHVPAGLPAYRHALEAMDEVLLSPERGAATDVSYDIAVIEASARAPARAAVSLFVGRVPEGLKDLVSVTEAGDSVVDWDRAAPLLRHVELTELTILDRPRAQPGVGATDYEARGYEVLVHGEAGPLLLRRQGEEGTAYYQLFHTDRSTLPYRVGFPVLVSNLVQVALRETGLAEARPVRTGALSGIELEPGRGYRVRTPDGAERKARVDDSGALVGLPAPRVGYYRFLAGGREVMRVGAALLSPEETGLAGVETLRFDEELTVSAADSELRTDRPLWRMLALVGFGVLLVEWWYYQGGVRRSR